MVVGLRSSRECDAEEHVSRDTHQTNREVQERKRVQRTTEKEHKELWAASHALRDLCAKAHGRSRNVRRPLVSASHIIWNDLFIGKHEACIMNRMKKEKSMLRNECNVYVLDLFVRVPPSVTAPVTYAPMEVDAINLVANGRERRKQVTFDCSKPFFDGSKIERGRQVQANRNRIKKEIVNANSCATVRKVRM